MEEWVLRKRRIEDHKKYLLRNKDWERGRVKKSYNLKTD